VPTHFAVIIALPVPVEAEQVTATFADGIITLNPSKVAQVRSKRIPIQSRSVFAGHVNWSLGRYPPKGRPPRMNKS
jgi:hypothetical protein